MRIVVLRPGAPGKELVAQLLLMGVSAIHCPLIDFQPIVPTATTEAPLHDLSGYSLIIALSARAVEFVQPWLPREPQPWPIRTEYYAVGKRSAQALQQQCRQLVHYPTGHSSSENLLALPRFSQVASDTILLLRGQGGRRYLVDQLTKRGARVRICHCYRRVPLGNHLLEQRDFWQQSAVNCLIVTSGELLRRLCTVVPSSLHSLLFHSWVVVVSERLAKIAYRLGWRQITIAENADNDALVRVITRERVGAFCQ